MQKSVVMFAALCSMGTLALAQNVKPRVIALYPEFKSGEAIVIPAASPLRLVSFQRDPETNVAFRGRFTLSGAYALEFNDNEFHLSLWPDKASRTALPYWRERGRPEEVYISNAQAFAQAVLPKHQLQNIRARKAFTVRGQVTIIAEEYETAIECDAANFSARFVSVVKVLSTAGKPRSEREC